MTRITGKVARILSETVLAINKGRIDGVTVGETFSINTPGIEIIDPDTDEVLGSTVYSKASVNVFQVFERFSLAQNAKKTSVLSFPIGSLTTRTLRVETHERAYSNTISVGDPVVSDRIIESEQPVDVDEEEGESGAEAESERA